MFRFNSGLITLGPEINDYKLSDILTVQARSQKLNKDEEFLTQHSNYSRVIACRLQEFWKLSRMSKNGIRDDKRIEHVSKLIIIQNVDAFRYRPTY